MRNLCKALVWILLAVALVLIGTVVLTLFLLKK